ncbi:MAG TPA: hypothetical protein VMM82_10020 [Spirochaetia bacterium]|nr:hypothetical protein [Spirochaetia bacterium]
MASSPAAIILPALTRLSAFSRFIFDQMLFGPRGVNLCSHQASSNRSFWPSIQP